MNKPTIVAEISCNHAGDQAKAFELIRCAAEAGADAVKLQLYEPEEMAWAGAKMDSGPWKGWTLVDLYRAAQTPRAWFPALFEYARSLRLEPFASAFSLDGVEYLEGLGCERYKVASAEVVWPELLEAVAATGKPAIISDGMASVREIRQALEVLDKYNTTVLRCVSSYPADPEQYGFADLLYDDELAYKRPHWSDWGVSDHSLNPVVPVTAAALGASVVEMHLMLPVEQYIDPPLDRDHSYEPVAFKAVADACREAAGMLDRPKQLSPDTVNGWRRRLVWGSDVKVGTVVHHGHVVTLRGDRGIQPYRRSEIVGKRLGHEVRGGEGVELWHVDEPSVEPYGSRYPDVFPR